MPRSGPSVASIDSPSTVTCTLGFAFRVLGVSCTESLTLKLSPSEGERDPIETPLGGLSHREGTVPAVQGYLARKKPCPLWILQ